MCWYGREIGDYKDDGSECFLKVEEKGKEERWEFMRSRGLIEEEMKRLEERYRRRRLY